jgi:hypothetical protein
MEFVESIDAVIDLSWAADRSSRMAVAHPEIRKAEDRIPDIPGTA